MQEVKACAAVKKMVTLSQNPTPRPLQKSFPSDNGPRCLQSSE